MNMHVEPPAIKDQITHVHALIDWYYDTHISKACETTSMKCGSVIKHLKDFFGEMRVEDVTQEATDEYIRARAAGEIGWGAKLNTVDKELRFLAAAINRAIRKRRVPRWAAPTFDTGLGWERRDRYLTRKEAAAYLRAARKYREMRPGNAAWKLGAAEVFVWIALYTAQRAGKIRALKWFPQVDFHGRTIDFVDRTKKQSKKRAARQPMHPIVFRVLRRWFRDCGNTRGLEVIPESFNHRYACEEICRMSGVKDVTPHVFRHTFITWRVAAGVPLPHIAMTAGVSMGTMMSTYAHLMPITGHDVMMAAKAKTISGARI